MGEAAEIKYFFRVLWELGLLCSWASQLCTGSFPAIGSFPAAPVLVLGETEGADSDCGTSTDNPS